MDKVDNRLEYVIKLIVLWVVPSEVMFNFFVLSIRKYVKTCLLF